MRVPLVVIFDPLLGNLSDLFKVGEKIGVQDFVSVGSIKSLDKGVLAGLAWLDVTEAQYPGPHTIRPVPLNAAQGRYPGAALQAGLRPLRVDPEL